MDILETIKKNLRISGDALDTAEIIPLIDAAKKELTIAGIKNISETDPMIIRYIAAYTKAHFGYDNPDADRFERVAESIKRMLSLSSGYTVPKYADDDNVTDDSGVIDDGKLE